jgi:hypothetical protein
VSKEPVVNNGIGRVQLFRGERAETLTLKVNKCLLRRTDLIMKHQSIQAPAGDLDAHWRNVIKRRSFRQD